MTSPGPDGVPHAETTHDWRPDPLLDGYRALTLPLGPDPDGEDPIEATLVRSEGPTSPRGVVLYVHGFTDYFFHEPLAEFFTERGFAFYALDLRKCGRSRRAHHTPHFTTDLRQYDEELGLALDVVSAEVPDAPVIVAAHSTGGLITALWLDRLRTEAPRRHARIRGLLLNSPWFDLQGKPHLRTFPVTMAIKGAAKAKPKAVVPQELSVAYGESIHDSVHGEWTYDLQSKPMGGFPVTFGFLDAVRSGQRRLHRGIDVGVPALVLRSDKTYFSGTYSPAVDVADAVLDVTQIARWSGALGNRVTVVPIVDARHDVFLSVRRARERAYQEADTWLQGLGLGPTDPDRAGTDPARDENKRNS